MHSMGWVSGVGVATPSPGCLASRQYRYSSRWLSPHAMYASSTCTAEAGWVGGWGVRGCGCEWGGGGWAASQPSLFESEVSDGRAQHARCSAGRMCQCLLDKLAGLPARLPLPSITAALIPPMTRTLSASLRWEVRSTILGLPLHGMDGSTAGGWGRASASSPHWPSYQVADAAA